MRFTTGDPQGGLHPWGATGADGTFTAPTQKAGNVPSAPHAPPPHAPDGKHLGTIKPPETPANCGWAEDGKTLYITARTSVYRIKLAVAGEKALYQ